MIDDEEIMESDDLDYADDDFDDAEEPHDGGKRDQQSRDWMLTIRAMDHTEDEVKALFEKIGVGAVFQREIGGKTEYEHFQCFLQVKSPMRFSTLKNHMKDKQGQRSDLIGLREQILDGMSVQEVLLGDSEAKAAHCTRWLGELEEAYVRKELGGKLRDIDAHYLYGAPGVGKTRYVYDHYSIEDIYRVTNYKHPFDEYDRHKVLVLDEYDSQLPWEQLLNYLDRYPVVLQACFTTVWIISNLPLAAQYPDIVGERRLALMRRLADCSYMTPEGELIKEPLPGRQEGGSP